MPQTFTKFPAKFTISLPNQLPLYPGFLHGGLATPNISVGVVFFFVVGSNPTLNATLGLNCFQYLVDPITGVPNPLVPLTVTSADTLGNNWTFDVVPVTVNTPYELAYECTVTPPAIYNDEIAVSDSGVRDDQHVHLQIVGDNRDPTWSLNWPVTSNSYAAFLTNNISGDIFPSNVDVPISIGHGYDNSLNGFHFLSYDAYWGTGFFNQQQVATMQNNSLFLYRIPLNCAGYCIRFMRPKQRKI